MAFNSAYLSKVNQMGPYNSLWAYETADAAATVDTSGYFTGVAVTMLKVGDVILRRTWSSAPPITTQTISSIGFHYVVSNDGTTVDVDDTLALTATNTD